MSDNIQPSPTLTSAEARIAVLEDDLKRSRNQLADVTDEIRRLIETNSDMRRGPVTFRTAVVDDLKGLLRRAGVSA